MKIDDYKKKCTIFLRNKGFNSNDTLIKLRDTDIFDNYRYAIENNIKKKDDIYFIRRSNNWFEWTKKYGSKIIFYNDTNLTIDEYNIFAD